VDVYFDLIELCVSNSSIGQHLMPTKKDGNNIIFSSFLDNYVELTFVHMKAQPHLLYIVVLLLYSLGKIISDHHDCVECSLH